MRSDLPLNNVTLPLLEPEREHSAISLLTRQSRCRVLLSKGLILCNPVKKGIPALTHFYNPWLRFANVNNCAYAYPHFSNFIT